MQSFDVFFVIILHKLLNEQPICWWVEMPWWSFYIVLPHDILDHVKMELNSTNCLIDIQLLPHWQLSDGIISYNFVYFFSTISSIMVPPLLSVLPKWSHGVNCPSLFLIIESHNHMLWGDGSFRSQQTFWDKKRKMKCWMVLNHVTLAGIFFNCMLSWKIFAVRNA